MYFQILLFKIESFFQKHQQKKLDDIWKNLKTDDQRRQMKDLFLTMTSAMKNFK